MLSPPAPLLLPFYVIPNGIHTFILSRCCNHLIKGQTVAARLAEVDGKSVCIRIIDTDCRFHFRIKAGRLLALHSGDADVTICGNSRDFWQLATRQQDADTLFFNRSLIIEGETETGVHIKNLLDAVDFDLDAHFDAVLLPPLSRVAKELKKIALCFKNKYESGNTTTPNP